MNDLVQFLRDRLDEDERAARATRQWSPRWYHDDFAHEIRDEANRGEIAYVPAEEDGEHIARHDPERVLADVEAKRAVLALHGDLDSGGHECPARDSLGEFFTAYVTPSECPTLQLLALPYAGHLDYRQEWRP